MQTSEPESPGGPGSPAEAPGHSETPAHREDKSNQNTTSKLIMDKYADTYICAYIHIQGGTFPSNDNILASKESVYVVIRCQKDPN